MFHRRTYTSNGPPLHAAAYTDGAELARHCDVLLLTVRDDALAPVSRELAASLTGDALPPQTCIFHCSGAMDLSPLEPLSRLGYPVGSLHPLQSFAEPSADRLKGIYMAVDGDERAKAVAADLVRTLGSTPFFVPLKTACSIMLRPASAPTTS